MKYDDFLKAVEAVDIPKNDSWNKRTGVGTHDVQEYGWGREEKRDETVYIYDQVETGGVSGGSCWDDSDPRHYDTGDSLGRFTALSTVVRALAPSVSFLEYESVLDKVERDSYTEREYYGNETTYEYQRISVRDLWGILSQCMAL